VKSFQALLKMTQILEIKLEEKGVEMGLILTKKGFLLFLVQDLHILLLKLGSDFQILHLKQSLFVLFFFLKKRELEERKEKKRKEENTLYS